MFREISPQQKGRDFEKRRAKELNLKQTRGSGSQWHDKGDARNDVCLVEFKNTEASQYILKKSDLKKIQKEALQKNKRWAMVINISGMEIMVCDGLHCEDFKSGSE